MKQLRLYPPHRAHREGSLRLRPSIVDFSNGASVATLDVLHGLCASGFECRAFCTPKLDLQKGTRLEHVLDDSRELYQVLPAACDTKARKRDRSDIGETGVF